jgi:hypothetical protein
MENTGISVFFILEKIITSGIIARWKSYVDQQKGLD